MTFNHYAKIKRILEAYPDWSVVRIDEPTSAKTFKGEVRQFDHYYRVVDADGMPIKYCKFQQIELFARTMGVEAEELPILH